MVIIHAGAEGATEDHVPYGTEYVYGEVRGDSRAFAHAVIDAGASIVLGSGPHVIRGVQRYRGRMIAYSLGDFACWNNLAPRVHALRERNPARHALADRRRARRTLDPGDARGRGHSAL